jgi:hypothetical protein
MLKKITFIVIISIAIFSFVINSLKAAGTEDQSVPQNNSVSLTNPLTNTTNAVDIPTLIGRVINGVLGVVGSLALVMFIYGGLMWMTSAGSDEKVKKGREILIWATMGLIVIFTSYTLVYFIIFKGIGAIGGTSTSETLDVDSAGEIGTGK